MTDKTKKEMSTFWMAFFEFFVFYLIASATIMPFIIHKINNRLADLEATVEYEHAD